MPSSSRLLKRRIRSITNTRKITRAMGACCRCKDAQNNAGGNRVSRIFEQLEKALDEVLPLVDPRAHSFLTGRMKSEKLLVIIAASDRGLCGGYNSRLLRTAAQFIQSRSETGIKVVTVGKRAESTVRRSGWQHLAALESVSSAPSFERSRPVGEIAHQEFASGRADRVFVIYTEYVSGLVQEPRIEQLLPLIPETALKEVGFVSEEEVELEESEILFEPNPREVLSAVIPRVLKSRMYQTLLESSASEHAARMVAMQSATKNAGEILDDLIFTYNQNRQSTITREMLEITAGKAAIE